MRKKNGIRMIAFALVIGLLAAIPASTQVLSRDEGVGSDGANLRMVVLINRLDLTKDQVQTIHDALAGVLAEMDALDSRRAEFYDEMLRFDGTADELDQALSAFRDEMSAAAEGLRSDMREALDEIAGTLTMKQGEILRRAIPGLFDRGEPGPRFGDRPSGRDVRRDAIVRRLGGHPQPGSDRGFAGREGRDEDLGSGSMMKGLTEKRVDLLRQFVETLELKLNYVE